MACSLCLTGVFAQVKVGDNPLEIDDASLIEIESTSKGFLPSRMTSTQRDLQTSWNTGHIIYNLTDSCLQIYSGTAWDCFVKGVLIDSTLYKYDGSLTDNRAIDLNGNSLTFDATGAQDVIIQADGDVGIGTTTPNAKLDVENGTVRFSDYGEGDYLSTGLILGVDADGDVIEIDTTNFVADDQTIDLFQILNDSLLISLEEDNADPLRVDLSDYAIDTSIYRYNGTLIEDRTLTLGGYNLTFSGTNNVTFESTGELGVGEPTPNAPIHITESNGTPASAIDGSLILEHSDAGGASSLVFKSSEDEGNDFGYIQYQDDGSGNGSNSENSLLTIGSGNDAAGSAGQDDIAIMSSGNVGIGTTSPEELLHVAGDMRLDGALEDKDGEAGTAGQVLTSTVTGTDWVDSNSIGTDDQNLSDGGKTGNNQIIDIEDGNSVTFSVADADSSTTNEIQDLTLSGNTLAISDDPNTDVDLTPYLDDTNLTQEEVQDFVGSMVLSGTETGITVTYDDANDEFDFVVDDDSATNEIQAIDSFALTGTSLALSLEGDGENPLTVDLSSLQDGTGTDDQDLSDGGKTGNNQIIDIEDGNSVTFSIADADSSTTNEIQDLTLSGNTLAISDDPNTDVDLAPYLDDTNLTQEEVQDFVGSMVSSGTETGISVTYDDANDEFDFVVDDDSATNEIQAIDSFALTGTSLALSLEGDGENPLTVDLSSLQDGTGSDDQDLSNGGKTGNNQTIDIEDGNSVTFSVADADSSTTNEIQDLTLSGNTLAISDDPNTDVDLSPYLDDTNLTQEEVQDFVGTMVSSGTETGISVTYDDANDEFDFVVDDDSATNEIQAIDSFALTGTSLALSLEGDGENPLTVDLSSLQDGTGSDDQDLSDGGKTGNSQTIDIENGNSVTFSVADADSSTTNEIQTVDQLILSGTDLLLSLESDGVPAESADLSDLQGPWDNLDTTPATQSSTDINYPGGNVGINDADPSERLQVNGNIEAGDDGAGTVALTINDGQGNANVTFNHTRGVPDNNGSSARIVSGVDATTGYLGFEVESNVTAGVSVNTTELMRIQDTGQIRFHEYGDGDFDDSNPSRLLGSTTAGQIVEYELSNITDDQVIDSFALTGTSLALSLENDGENPLTVDLSSLQDGTGTDDQTLTYTNADPDDDFNTLQIEGSAAFNIADNHLGTINQTLSGARTIGLNSNSLTIDGSSRDMVISSAGNVGIGVASPARPLHVDEALRLSRGANSTSFIFDRWNGSIGTTWASAGFFLESSSAGTGEFFISNYKQNVGGSAAAGKAFSIDLATDQLAFPQYGDGTFDSSSPSRLLGVNTDGDILEIVPELDSFELTGNTLAISLNGDGLDALTVDLSTISGSSDNIYNTNGSLDAARTVNLNSNNLTFDGTGTGDVVIQSDGDVGIGTTSPSGDLEVRSDQDQEAFRFVQEDGTTGQKDVFTIEDQDVGGGGQDESSVLKVHKSGAISSGDNGFSLVELANTGTDPGANKYWISGRKTDEGAPLWGVDITDNDYWSEGGMILGVTGADGGTYSGGTFRVEADGDVGIGTTAPNARLEVDGGSVRFSDYGANTYVDTSVNTILTVQPDGDIRELNTAKNTRWFYPPAIVIDASALDTMATLDLHADYVDQFGSPLISSDGASGYVPYYLEDELEYYVTDYDTTILRNISIDADGVMTYDVYSVPFDNYTVINVVFVIKDP